MDRFSETQIQALQDLFFEDVVVDSTHPLGITSATINGLVRAIVAPIGRMLPTLLNTIRCF
jgi:hypothetical protein